MAVGVQVPPSAPSNEKAPLMGLFYELQIPSFNCSAYVSDISLVHLNWFTNP